MKTIEKKQAKKPAGRNPRRSEEIKTDPPISERDEVKTAEEKMRKAMIKK